MPLPPNRVDYSPIIDRPAIKWPNEARVALWIAPNVEHYEYLHSIWIECSFETALERAVSRAQEGLPPKETIRDYRTIYIPAQEIHFQRDNPKGVATFLVNNDARLGPISWSK